MLWKGVTLSALAASAAADAACALLSGGTLRLYAGQRPASADAPVADQDLLAELRFATPAFARALDGEALANKLEAAEASASGEATWFRALGPGGRAVFDGSAGVGPGFDLELNAARVQAGGKVSVQYLRYAQAKN